MYRLKVRRVIRDVTLAFLVGLSLGLILGNHEAENRIEPSLKLAERTAEACGENLKFHKFKLKEAEIEYLNATGKELEIDEGKYIRRYYFNKK